VTENARLVAVTPTEARVLRELLRDGADYRTIGMRLGVVEETVKSHAKALLRKTHCRSATALVVEVLREFVICIEPVRANPRRPRDVSYLTVDPPG
jgi:DNA-binding NarL/FixJ family response regulator